MEKPPFGRSQKMEITADTFFCDRKRAREHQAEAERGGEVAKKGGVKFGRAAKAGIKK